MPEKSAPQDHDARGAEGETLPRGIADRLRRDILLGRLAPGSTVKERDTAAELNVSRTPMREAIRILAQEGLLVLRTARSPIVANPDFKQVSDDLTVIIALESLSGRLACIHATQADLDGLAEIQQRLIEARDTADPVDLFEIDMTFHRSIALASHNASLATTHAAYLGRLWRARFLSASQRRNRMRVVNQHGAILAALQSRDPAEAARHIERHLQDLVVNIADGYQAGETAATADGLTGKQTGAAMPTPPPNQQEGHT